jgi:hypothetical protein
VGRQVAGDEPPYVALDTDILASGGPQTLNQLLGRDIEPDDLSAAVEPGSDRRVGHDAVGRDDPAKSCPGMRPLGSAQARDLIGAPARHSSEIDEPSAVALRERSTDGPGATSGRADQDGFHRATMRPLDRGVRGRMTDPSGARFERP